MIASELSKCRFCVCLLCCVPSVFVLSLAGGHTALYILAFALNSRVPYRCTSKFSGGETALHGS